VGVAKARSSDSLVGESKKSVACGGGSWWCTYDWLVKGRF